MKKILTAAILTLMVMTSGYAFDLGSSSSIDTSIDTSAQKFLADSYSTLLQSQKKEAQVLLQLSEQLKDQTQSYLDSFVRLNEDYIKAMLRLSDDIGKMADRIGEMADRIVYTEVLIGQMADRIVVVAKDILDFCAKTQENLLQAQANLNKLLLGLKK